MALGFNARLKKELRRRDAAMLQMKLAADATTNIVKQKSGELKSSLIEKAAPKNLIAAHPWPAILIGMAAGAVSAIVFKKVVFPPPQPVQFVGAGQPVSPQTVVVEAPGGDKKKPTSPWKQIFDAMLAGAPFIIAQAQKFMHAAQEDGQSRMDESEEQRQVAQGVAPSGSATTQSALHPSISRRSAPPPQENS